ncbi:MAG: type III-A CRISPR-associated protein Csm2 [Syntrophorhabdales bacterium]
MEIKFWRDKSKKLIDPELFSGHAEDLARAVASESNDRTNAPTQIRKFYDQVVRFDSIVKTNPEEFDILIPYIKMLNAKAAYAHARESGGNPLISQGFREFITRSLEKVNDRDDFEVFASFFEAFMGFYKLLYEQKKIAAKQHRAEFSGGVRK